MKLPPYGKPLYEKLLKEIPVKPGCVYLFIGEHGWKRAAGWAFSYPESTLLLPPWLSPYNFYWPVQNYYVYVIQTGYSPATDDYLLDIARCMYEHGAFRVGVESLDFVYSIYHKEV